MARKNLADMLIDDHATTAHDTSTTVPEVEAPEAPEAASTVVPGRAKAPAKYLQLVRKEARFTDDQLQGLTALTRQLNRTRNGTGERITDNTIIRVAVDLILTDDRLAGTTEHELRKSVGL